MSRLALLLAGSLVACSSPQSEVDTSAATEADFQAFCAALCSARSKCEPVVIDECTTGCVRGNAPFVGKMRADYVKADRECALNASCEALPKCDDSALARIVPRPSTERFCEHFVAKSTHCLTSTTELPVCLSVFKEYSDSALAAADECLAKSCSEYGPCTQHAVGVR